jgi:long-chain acyl-CoA synthetase
MTKKPPFTVEVPGSSPMQGETIPRRNARSPNKLVSQPEDGVNTLYDIVKRGASKFGDLNAVGWRTLLKTHHEMKKIKKVVEGKVQEVDKNWTYFELSGYSYLTFKEYETLTYQIGAGLRRLGLKKPDRVHLFAATRYVSPPADGTVSNYSSAHWLAMAHGTMSQSMAIVTAYDTLGEEGLRHSLVSTKAKAIFMEPHLLHTFIKTLSAAKSIEFIILNTDNDDEIRVEDLETLKMSHDHITVLKYEDLRRMGEENFVDPVPPSREDLCCIMYTSGSSGAPKGVPIKHKAVVAAGKATHHITSVLAYTVYSFGCYFQRGRLSRTWRFTPYISPTSSYL